MTIEAMLAAIMTRLEALRGRPRILIAIDGPCGGGKTTLAQHLSQLLQAPVVHMDDFSIPHAMKTAERLAQPGGNLDIERFMKEALTPLTETGHACYRPYDCHADAFAEPVIVPDSRHVIFEGSYSMLPQIASHTDLQIFLHVSPQTQQERLLKRVGPQRIGAFNARWIPLEQAYFAACHLPDDRCLLLEGDQETGV